MDCVPVMDARKELRNLEGWIRKVGVSLRQVVERVEEEEAAGAAEKHNNNYNMAKAKLHGDYDRLLEDEDLVEYGVSTCRLPLPVVHTIIHCVCFSYPDSLPDRLRAIAMLFLWNLALDDFFDDPHIVGDNPEMEKTLAFLQTSIRSCLLLSDVDVDEESKQLASAMVGEANNDLNNLMMRGAERWCEEFRQLGMLIAQQRRFVETLEDYMGAVFEQNRYRCSGSYPAELRDYLALRAKDSATYCCVALVEFSIGIDVLSGLLSPCTEGLRASLHSLCAIAVLEVSLYNDLRSLQKEFDAGDLFNAIPYVYVHMMKKKKNEEPEPEEGDPAAAMELLEASIKEVLKMVADYRLEARKLEAEIDKQLFLFLSSSSSNEDDIRRTLVAADIRRFLAALADMVVGIGRWQELSSRYY